MPIYSFRLFTCSSCSLIFKIQSSISSLEGRTVNSPVSPYIITSSPFFTLLPTTSAPIMAGIFIFLAKIEMWDVRLPFSVIIPEIRLLSKDSISEGSSSFATSIIFSSPSDDFLIFLAPPSCMDSSIRFLISAQSADLARRYSSSIFSNMAPYSSNTLSTAHEALIFSFSISLSIRSMTSSSDAIIR